MKLKYPLRGTIRVIKLDNRGVGSNSITLAAVECIYLRDVIL